MKNSIFAIAGQGVASFGTLVYSSFIIRGTGLEGFGDFSMVMLLLIAGVALQGGLMVSPAFSLIGKLKKLEANHFKSWLLFVELLFVLLFLGGLQIALLLGIPAFPASIGPMAGAFFIGSRLLFLFFRQMLFLDDRGPSQALRLDGVHFIASVSALFGLSFSGHLNPATSVLALGASATLAALWGFVLFSPSVPRPFFPRKSLLIRYRKMAVWMGGKGLAQYFSGNYFLLALGAIQGPIALGGIRAAQTLVGTLGIFLAAFENTFPAKATRAFAAGGKDQLRLLVKTSYRPWFALLAISAGFLIFFANFFLALIAGAPQPNLKWILVTLSAVSLVALSIQIFVSILNTCEMPRPIFFAMVASAGLGAIFAKPVVEAFGTWGCLGGIVAQQLIIGIVLFFSARIALSPKSQE